MAGMMIENKALMGLVVLALIISFVNAYNIFSLKSELLAIEGNLISGVDGAAAAGTGGNDGLREVQKGDGATGAAAPVPTVPASLEGDDPFLGPEDAKVTVVEFSDFECPYCMAAAGTHPDLIARFKSQDPSWEAPVPKLMELARAGTIKLVFRDYPLTSIHQNAQKAAEAAECADDQGKFWEYHDRLFEAQSLGISSLKQHAVDLGLDAAAFNDCLDSGKYAAEVANDVQEGSSNGVSGTPAFFVNGRLVSGAQPFSVFEQIIQQELNK